MPLYQRFGGWVLKTLGLGWFIAGAFSLVDGGILAGAAYLIAGLGLAVVGSYVAPGPGTGAFMARYMMETNNELHMVKPPGANVLDPISNEDTRFRGR